MTTPGQDPAEHAAAFSHTIPRSYWKLMLGAIGVVYGDIGTSPLYAMRESLAYAAADGLERAEVIGLCSLLLWSLIVISSGR